MSAAAAGVREAVAKPADCEYTNGSLSFRLALVEQRVKGKVNHVSKIETFRTAGLSENAYGRNGGCAVRDYVERIRGCRDCTGQRSHHHGTDRIW